jgi:hypothetical protein
MLRAIKIGAIVALATVIGGQAAGADTLTWGIFRENATSISESLRNCWAQAMVSGQTINGEVMAENLSQQKAEVELQRLAKKGQCAAERTSASWSARGQGSNTFGDSDDGGRSFGGSSGNGSASDWSNAGRFGGDSGSSQAGPMGGR